MACWRASEGTVLPSPTTKTPGGGTCARQLIPPVALTLALLLVAEGLVSLSVVGRCARHKRLIDTSGLSPRHLKVPIALLAALRVGSVASVKRQRCPIDDNGAMLVVNPRGNWAGADAFALALLSLTNLRASEDCVANLQLLVDTDGPRVTLVTVSPAIAL